MAERNTNEFDQLLQLAKGDDLLKFMRQYAQENSAFRKELTAFLGKKYLRSKATITDYRNKMCAAFEATNDLGDRWHSFEVIDWDAVADNVKNLLDEGNSLLDLGNADAAAIIAVEFFLVLQQEFNTDELYDDSEEHELTEVCEQAQELLNDAFTHPYINKSLRSQLMNNLHEISRSSLPGELNNLYIFDFDDMMLKLSKVTMGDDERLQMLEQQIIQHAGRYDQHVYVQRKIDLLRELHRDNEADAEQQKHINLPEVRAIVVDQCVERGDYDAAVSLVHEGIDIAKQIKHLGTVKRWKEKELAIYERMGDKARQIDLCRTLFVNERASKEYYRKLKALVPHEQWKDYLKLLLDEVKEERKYLMFGQNNVADIYVEEGDNQSLFELLKSHERLDLDILNRYARYTGNEHAQEILAIYTEILKQDAMRNVNVKAYRRIAEAMSCMCQLNYGKQAAHKLALFFRQEYSRRPSMMAEIKNF